MTLKLNPSYYHMNDKYQEPPPTRLTPETAFAIYRQLVNCLAVERRSLCPAEGWDKARPRRDLFYKNGFHHHVEWKPDIDEARYRRLSYEEFLIWYGILRGPNEKGKSDFMRPAAVCKVDRRAPHQGSRARCRKGIVGWIKRLVRGTPDLEA
jgi:hypothetical protein